MNELKDNIESLREKLYQLIEENELTDVNVVRCSQELDMILMEYEKNKLKELSFQLIDSSKRVLKKRNLSFE